MRVVHRRGHRAIFAATRENNNRRVGKVEIVVDKRRVDGTRVLVAEVEVGDDTGSMSVRARDGQIDLLRNIASSGEEDGEGGGGVGDGTGGGGSVVLRNCNMELYLGKYLRLGVSKWGKLSAYPVSFLPHFVRSAFHPRVFRGRACIRRNFVRQQNDNVQQRDVTPFVRRFLKQDGIESTPIPPSRINRELNFSIVDLNTVASARIPDEAQFPLPVANVRQNNKHHHPTTRKAMHHHHEKQRHHHYHHQDASSMTGGVTTTPTNYRGRSSSSSGGGNYVHQKKDRDDWQHRPQQQQQQQQQHYRAAAGSQMESAVGRSLFQHPRQQGGGGSPPPSFRAAPQQVHYQQQYGDAGSVYSYQSSQHSEHQGAGASPGRANRTYLPPPAEDHYSHQQYIYQQYHDLHLRHAHQIMLLQQQQESQIRILEQQAAVAISRVDSHESGGGGYTPVHSAPRGGGGDHFGGTLSPSSLLSPLPPRGHGAVNDAEYQYGAPLPSPMHIRGEPGTATYATVSPPISPAHRSHPSPQALPQYPDYRREFESDEIMTSCCL
jgi:hypothetical protein